MNEFTCRVTTHGKQQLELQLTCPLAWHRKKVRYRISVYLFFPPQLQMTASRYGVKSFLQDIISYTRFTTPVMSLQMLLDPANDKSPFVRIPRYLNEAKVGGDLAEKSVEFELKSLINIYQRHLKDTLRQLKKLAGVEGTREDAVHQAQSMLRDMEAILAQLRQELRPRFLEANIPETLRQAFEWSDESISLSTEKFYFRLHGLCNRREGLDDLEAEVTRKLEVEATYRASRGFPSLVDPSSSDQNFAFLQQESMLKKWAQNTYYMTQEKMRSVQHLTTLLMAVAAMVAMLFAVVATFLANHYFPQNSVPFALMLIVAYAFKDRIKETLRAVFLSFLPRLVSDRKNKLISPTGRVIGNSSLHVAFNQAHHVPEDIQRLRYMTDNIHRALIPPEDVIEFHKRIVFQGAMIKKMHSRLESVTEILRFYLGNWLQYMDDPDEQLQYCRDGKPATVQAKRVYPVHIILKLEDPGTGSHHLYGYNMLLSRDGVVRIRQEADLS